MIIAVDGPSGAGKSTVCKMLSKRLKFEYIDTGAMYRALAYKLFENNIKATDDNLKNYIDSAKVDYIDNNVYLDGKNVEPYIRNQHISALSSEISKIQFVREKLVMLQRQIASTKNIILDGRDIGTVVFPNADFKFFITASAETRANRRYLELKEKGQDVNFENILQDINKRDYNDINRDISPLKIADDAIVIDTQNLNAEEVVQKLLDIIRG